MHVLIPFDQCIARPDEKETIFLLQDHLIQVKKYMELRLGEYDPILVKLMGLAGICHDLAKSHEDWQSYIRGKKSKGPHHAPEGALFFSFYAYHVLQSHGAWDSHCVYWLWLIRDIADHHGSLKNIAENHWISLSQWDKMDMGGLAKFVKTIFPELIGVEISPIDLEKWLDQLWDIFEQASEQLDLSYRHIPSIVLMEKLQLWREITTTLIVGDRLDVAPVIEIFFKRDNHVTNDRNLELFCAKNKYHPLAYARMKAQQEILSQMKAHPHHKFYTLEMPTGYGKTITSLRLASFLGSEQGYEKIIYVAPYISILEQTARVIEESMNILAMEHHSLAILAEEKHHGVESEEYLINNQISVETWAHPVICTSFQQWTKAIFPERAQDVLRRAFLKNSVIIIDEPQIFRPEIWNVFLCGLEALAGINNLRIIFLSATMPPFTYGLSQEPAHLSIQKAVQTNRYQVVRRSIMDEKSFANFMLDHKDFHQCAILNTIADAYLVYKGIKTKNKNYDTRLIHGMMIPLHKKMEICKIQKHLSQKSESPICVVSTQVIEAGVDLSFCHLARALPILPSIVQAAGRVNRHNEGKMGILSLVPFLREGKKNTRDAIYDKKLQGITDRLLERQEVWLESEMMDLIKMYYEEMFRQNTYETGKQAIIDAYEGNWPALSCLHPFGGDYYRLPIFVPWVPAEEDSQWLPEKFRTLQQKTGVDTPEKIYEMYSDREYMHRLSFQERKEFMILFHHYVINLPVKLALTLASKEDYLKQKIPCVFGDDVYNPVMGLAPRYVDGFDTII